MNPVDDTLRRLLQSAAQAPQPPPPPLPVALETRVLARWRSLEKENGFALLLPMLFRRAVLCASLVVVASILWVSHEERKADASVIALANYEINSLLPP